MVKIRFILIMNRVVQNNRNRKDIRQFEVMINEMKKAVTEKVYYRKQSMDLFLKHYISSKTKERYSKSANLMENMEKEVMK